MTTLSVIIPAYNEEDGIQAIMEREKGGATMIGNAVAVPHARLEGFSGLRAALGPGVARNAPAVRAASRSARRVLLSGTVLMGTKRTEG